MTDMTIVRRIAARPSIVFEALTTEEGIASWWGPDDIPVISANVDATVGGHFRVHFRTSDGLEHISAGEFLEIIPAQRIIMSWRWTLGGVAEEHGAVSRLEFHLRSIDGGTELTLIHAALHDDASARSHNGGWNGSLDKLERHLAKHSNI
ncbi:MAG: SRPBCC domain-containing protein [Gemmatimonadales bacterium]